MPRTTRDHERMESLDRRDREREQEAYRQRKAREDEDTIHDLPVGNLTVEAEPSQPAGEPDDLKCERVQARGPALDCEEG